MECCSIRDLRSLSAAHGICLHGLLEKHEIVEALRSALPDHVICKWLYCLEKREEVPVASMEVPSQTPSYLDESQRINCGLTEHIVATYTEQSARNVAREALVRMWFPIPDAAGGQGMWRFAEPIDELHGASLFYPLLHQNRLGLVFRNPRWMAQDAQLQFGFVLAWCPADYVWLYCMLCAKFVFPFFDTPNHIHSNKHRNAVQRWREQGDQKTIDDALRLKHKHPFFLSSTVTLPAKAPHGCSTWLAKCLARWKVELRKCGMLSMSMSVVAAIAATRAVPHIVLWCCYLQYRALACHILMYILATWDARECGYTVYVFILLYLLSLIFL